MRHGSSAPGAKPGFSNRFSFVLWSLALASTCLLCALAGNRREVQLKERSRAAGEPAPLRYGALLPSFRLTTAAGRRLESRQLLGTWTLLVFAARWCPACDRELRILARAHRQPAGRVHVLPVLEGSTWPLSPSAAAARYAQRNNLSFEMATDPDGTAGSECGTEQVFPYAVLVDPHGLVRLSDSGSSITQGGSSLLVDSLKAFFVGSSPASMALTHWAQMHRAPDAPVLLQDGRHTRLSALGRAGTLVVTFLTGGDPMERRRITAIERLSAAPGVRFLVVASGPGAKPSWLRQHGSMLLAERDTGPLFAAFGVERGPISIIMRRGRQVLREDVAQQAGDVFEKELAYAVFLSAADGSSQAPGDTARSAGLIGTAG